MMIYHTHSSVIDFSLHIHSLIICGLSIDSIITKSMEQKKCQSHKYSNGYWTVTVCHYKKS